MPFKSEAQRKFMWARHPKIAKEFEKHTPEGAKLPRKVRTTKKTKNKRKSVKRK